MSLDATQGTNAVITSLWYDETDTMLIDLTSLSISIVDATGHLLLGPTGIGITHPGTGVYSYTWAVPADQAPGQYAAVWSGVDADGDPVLSDEDITVLTSTPSVSPLGSWATTDDVLTYTGQSVDAGTLAKAQAIIDIFAGRTYDAQPRTGRRDQYWLKLAVSFQAAWLPSQPDLYQRIDLAAITMSNRAVALKDDSLRIAPLAQKALSKVSWMRGRSLHVKSPFQDSYGGLLNPNVDSAANDQAFPWFPITGYG